MKIKIAAYKSPTSSLNSSEPKSMHPRIVGGRTLDTRLIAAEIQHKCTVTEADIAAVLNALAQAIGQCLTDGQSINLEGIGSFVPVPAFNRKIYEGERYSGADVTMKQIHFAPAHELLQKVRYEAEFERVRATHSRKLLPDEAYIKLLPYLQEHGTIDVDAAVALLSVKRDKAYRLLGDLTRQGKLTCGKVHGTNYYRLLEA